MKEIIDDIARWRAAGHRVALARVVDLEGSGPRGPGAAMAVNDDGDVAGSVSGGCVEGAVVTEALDLLGGAGPGRLVTFGYSDDDAFAVGLTCGGTIHLFVEPVDWQPVSILDELRRSLAAAEPVALVTIVDGIRVGAKLLVQLDAEPVGTLGDADLDRVVARDALGELAAGRSGMRHYGAQGQANQTDVAVFVESHSAPPRMIIFGAVDFTAALCRVAKVLGYHVTVCDAREVFATRSRFPQADEVVVDWPHRLLADVGATLGPADAVCVLTHDHRFDVPAIKEALGTQVGYLGIMGSRRTHHQRLARLAEEGVDSPADLARLRSPVGLDIGARTPEETAVAICAEIVADRAGREGLPLRRTKGPIHAAPPPTDRPKPTHQQGP